MKIRIVPYRKGSSSAKMLAKLLTSKLGYKVWRGSPRSNRNNIFWGKSNPDKRRNFEAFTKAGVFCVPYTVSAKEAQAWLEDGRTVFARTPGGQGGSGITVVEPGGVLPAAPLYTQYVKKKKEFRVHVMFGKAVFVQEKRKKHGVEANYLIRSHNRGWVFCTKDIVEPNGLRVLAVDAVRAIGLDFGAVDIIWNEKSNTCYVLEVNSAPGLCPTTTEIYANEIAAQVSKA